MTPLVASRSGPPTLYLGGEVLFKRTDRGDHWSIISPDLAGKQRRREHCDGDVTLEAALPCGYGMIIAIEPSPRRPSEIWTGTDNGSLTITRDGGATGRNSTASGDPPVEQDREHRPVRR